MSPTLPSDVLGQEGVDLRQLPDGGEPLEDRSLAFEDGGGSAGEGMSRAVRT